MSCPVLLLEAAAVQVQVQQALIVNPVHLGRGWGWGWGRCSRCSRCMLKCARGSLLYCRVVSSLVLVTRQRAPAWGCCCLVELLVVDHFAHVRARHRDQGTKYGVVLTKKVPRRKVSRGSAEQPESESVCVCGLEDTLPFQHLGIDPVMVCPWSRSFAIATSTWMHPSLSGGDPVRDLAFLSQPRLFGELKLQQGA